MKFVVLKVGGQYVVTVSGPAAFGPATPFVKVTGTELMPSDSVIVQTPFAAAVDPSISNAVVPLIETLTTPEQPLLGVAVKTVPAGASAS